MLRGSRKKKSMAKEDDLITKYWSFQIQQITMSLPCAETTGISSGVYHFLMFPTSVSSIGCGDCSAVRVVSNVLYQVADFARAAVLQTCW